MSSWRPVCGLLQVAGNDKVLGIMEPVASGVDIKQPPHREQLELFQTKAAVLALFILKHYRGHSTDTRNSLQTWNFWWFSYDGVA